MQQYTLSTDQLFHLTGNNGVSGNTTLLGIKSFNFPGGEVQTQLLTAVERELSKNRDAPIILATRLTSADKIIELGQAADILRRRKYTNINAFIPYIPYMQQDRVMTDEAAESAMIESFSLSVFAKILNTFEFNSVFCIDPHSTVTNDNLIKGLRILSNHPYLHKATQGFDIAKGGFATDVDYLVAPDEGAVKKTLKYSLKLKIPYIISFKQRDPLTGKITGIRLPIEEGEKITGKRVLITDDICVGGMTFIELAKELRKYNPKSIKLFITHGIFTKGTALEGIDKVYCTNSCKTLDDTESFIQYPLEIPNV